MVGRGGWLWVSFFLLGACGDDDGPAGRADAAAAVDAAVALDAAGEVDGGGEPRTVTGSDIRLHVSAAGEEMTPVDLSGAVIEILLDDGAGGTVRLPVTGGSDGTFSLDAVPAGLYMLRVNDDYFVTDRSAIDLGFAGLGRAGAASATTSPTRLRWVVDGMDAWQVDDRLDFFAPNAGSSYLEMEDEASTPPLDPDTSINMAVDYTNATEPRLVDAAAGDVGYLLHLSLRGTDPAWVVTQTFEPAAFTMIDGQRTRLTGSFQDVALDRSVDIDLRTSAFAALTDSLSGGFTFEQQTHYAIYTSPYSIDRGDLGFIQLADYAAPDLADRTLTIDYGHPFPADWTPYASQDFLVLSRVDDAPFTFALGAIGAVDTVAGLSDQPITVRLGPVGSPTVDGADATQPSSAGTTPEIAWTAPAIGTPELYHVHVRQVSESALHGLEVASFTTPATRVRIPEGVLEVGETYFLEIDALFNPDVDLLASPRRFASPRRTLSRRPTSTIVIE